MKTKLSIAVLMAAALGLSAPLYAAGQHEHSGSASGLSQLTLNDGVQWQTDPSLREGMEAILQDLSVALPKIHEGELPEGQYGELAEKVNGHLDFIISNCQLSPAADEQLHFVLGEVMNAVQIMKTGPDRKNGAVLLVQALDAYGRHFDHPNWTGLKHQG